MPDVVIRFPREVGGLIRLARRRRGWTIQRLALELGYDPSALARIEREEPCHAADWRLALAAGTLLQSPAIRKTAVRMVLAEIGARDHDVA